MACKKRWILLTYNYVQFMFCRFAHVRNKMEGRNNIWKKAWQLFPNKVINVNNINKHIDYHFYNLIKNQMKTSVDILYLMSPMIPNNFYVFVILSIVFECYSPAEPNLFTFTHWKSLRHHVIMNISDRIVYSSDWNAKINWNLDVFKCVRIKLFLTYVTW